MQSSKKQNKTIAKQRIIKLFSLVEKKAFEKDFELSDIYIHIARKISMKYLVPIPSNLKKKYCKHCYSYLQPSVNSTTRINNGRIIIFCQNCGKYTRIPFKQKK